MLICARCSQEKYTAHVSTAPHGSTPTSSPCEAYLPAHPCLNCGLDVEQHEPTGTHPRIINTVIVCAAVETDWDEPAFEGGGGSSGGGGASDHW